MNKIKNNEENKDLNNDSKQPKDDLTSPNKDVVNETKSLSKNEALERKNPKGNKKNKKNNKNDASKLNFETYYRYFIAPAFFLLFFGYIFYTNLEMQKKILEINTNYAKINEKLSNTDNSEIYKISNQLFELKSSLAKIEANNNNQYTDDIKEAVNELESYSDLLKDFKTNIENYERNIIELTQLINQVSQRNNDDYQKLKNEYDSQKEFFEENITTIINSQNDQIKNLAKINSSFTDLAENKMPLEIRNALIPYYHYLDLVIKSYLGGDLFDALQKNNHKSQMGGDYYKNVKNIYQLTDSLRSIFDEIQAEKMNRNIFSPSFLGKYFTVKKNNIFYGDLETYNQIEENLKNYNFQEAINIMSKYNEEIQNKKINDWIYEVNKTKSVYDFVTKLENKLFNKEMK